MEAKFIKKVQETIAREWNGDNTTKVVNGILIVYFEGKEIAFIKDYKADCEEGGSESAVETLQYYCDTF